jgi:transcriptional regulator with XRE-family HTH domain
MYEKHEIIDNFCITVERERVLLKYSQAEMARALDMSLSSYKKIICGESIKIGIYTVYLLECLTGKFMHELCQLNFPFSESMPLLRKLSKQQLRFVNGIMEFEIAFTRSLKSDLSPDDFVTMFVPTGNMHDGMFYDSCDLMKVNVASYRHRYGKMIDCALMITSSHLQPVYQENDILLICRGPIRDGDTGIFVDNNTGRVYLRKYFQSVPNRMEPLVGYGQTLFINNNSKEDSVRWSKIGFVIAKMH